MSRDKAHQQYQVRDGTLVPGVTTVLSVLAKPALVPWAWKLGRDGIDLAKYVDDKADIGHLAHQMILDYFRDEKTVTDDYSKNQIDAAENAFLSFLEWAKGKRINPLMIERPLVSEVYRFGGTPDLVAEIDGELAVVDFKTGRGLYEEHWIQVAGYYALLGEAMGETPAPTKAILVNIPRTEDESFVVQEKTTFGLFRHEGIFLAALSIYQLQSEMKAEASAIRKAAKAKAKEKKHDGKSKGGTRGKRTRKAAGDLGPGDVGGGSHIETRGDQELPGCCQEDPNKGA